MWARWSSGKDEVLQVRKARIDSWLCRKHFKYQASLLINSTRDEKKLSRIKKGVTASVGEVV